jgi:hypothetical protein
LETGPSVLDDFIAVSVPHVDTMGEMFAILHRPQSSSASRFTAGAAGSLLLSLEAAKAWRNLASAGKEAAIVVGARPIQQLIAGQC